MRARHRKFPNHLDPYQSPWLQRGYPGSTRDTIEDDQPPIGTSIDKKRWHALGRGSILSDLPLQFERIRTRWSR